MFVNQFKDLPLGARFRWGAGLGAPWTKTGDNVAVSPKGTVNTFSDEFLDTVRVRPISPTAGGQK